MKLSPAVFLSATLRLCDFVLTPVFRTERLAISRWIVVLVALLLAAGGCSTSGPEPRRSSTGPGGPGRQQVVYRGWTNSWVLTNAQVEAVVVPALGRVMQFRFRGEKSGPFWENDRLEGRLPDPQATEWFNVGGDKTWPAPQADWPQLTGRGWPPPSTFDAVPLEVVMNRRSLTLVSPVDPHYGIRTRRTIALHPTRPEMSITTHYEKVEGKPVRVGIWTITQLKDPVGVYAKVPDNSLLAGGFNLQSAEPPPSLRLREGWLSLKRDPKTAHKIGLDAAGLLWVGEQSMVWIESPLEAGRVYPDQGSSVEVYTNPDPLSYVELELLGPLEVYKPGTIASRTTIYTLFRRTRGDPEADARRVLGSGR